VMGFAKSSTHRSRPNKKERCHFDGNALVLSRLDQQPGAAIGGPPIRFG
jgi:hypothetical protein